MRFEVVAAYAMGVALPILETLRRRTNFDPEQMLKQHREGVELGSFFAESYE